MTDIAITPAPADRVLPLNRDLRAARNSLFPEGHKRNRHWHDAGPGVTQDTIRDRAYWSMVATKLQRHDTITVLADDESWEAELVIERVVQDAAEVSVRKVMGRQSIMQAGRVVDGIGEFVSEWRAGLGWCIIRRKDGVPVVQGHANEAVAIAEWQRMQPRKVA